MTLDAVDRIYLDRACELAARGEPNVAPNPAVGAVVVRDGVTLGEGFHHRSGQAHAEIEALRGVADAHGATLYVSLEPCDHVGLTPACTQALIVAGIKRVVVGALDPNPRTNGAGIERLRAAGIEVEIAQSERARSLIAPFAVSVLERRPFVTLKLAASVDGYVAAAPGSTWLTGQRARAFVRDLRIAHAAVMVGAGTVRVDDPQLTVRPPAARFLPYLRVVACETDPVPKASRVFVDPVDGAAYGRTIVLAPGGSEAPFASLQEVAEVVYVGVGSQLDLTEAMQALRERGVTSVLCEGGPTLAARMLEHGLVDRLMWLLAPRLLAGETAVPALAHVAALDQTKWAFVAGEPLGDDLLLILERR